MLRPLYENVYIVTWIFVSLLLLCVSGYFLVGKITKKYGISLKLLLIGEEYIVALISSIVIFLVLSFPIALIVWLIVIFLINYFFKNNRRLVSYIIYCEQNKKALTSRQLRLLSQLNPCLKSTSIILWIKVFQHLRRGALCKIDRGVHINHIKYKCRAFPFSIFTTGVIGISLSLLTYGRIDENSSSFLMLLLQNYAILSGILFVLYTLLYFSLVGNIFHYMYGHKRLFKFIFAVFSVLMYVAVTAISMNNR